MIPKDLSAAQHNGQVGKILPQRAAATQERIPVALIDGKNLSVTASNLKVEDDAMLNDSMPLLPPSLPADDALSGESCHLWTALESSPWVPSRTKMLSPRIRCRVWTDDGNMTLATRNAGTSRLGGPASTFNKVACRRRQAGHLRPWASDRSAESHSFVERTKVSLKGLTALQYNGRVGKIWENCTTASTQKNAVREKSDSPVVLSPQNQAGGTQHTRTTYCEHH